MPRIQRPAGPPSIDPSGELGANRSSCWHLRISRTGVPLRESIAWATHRGLAGKKDRSSACCASWSRPRSFSLRHICRGDANPATSSDAHAFADPDMVNSMVSSGATVTNLGSNFLERLGNQSSNGFNRLQRTNPGGGGASAEHERAALPDLVRGLRQFDPERRGRGFRRRQANDMGRRRRDRRAGGAGHQSRLLRRPEPLRRSTFRWRCNRRRST